MISVVQNRNVYEIRFRYDPVLVDYVKAVPGRSWNAIQKYWTIPLDKLGFFINQIKGTNYEPMLKIQSDEHLNENATLDSTAVIPNVDISEVPIYVGEGFSPYSHQLDFMKYAIFREATGNKRGFLLGDDPGLGKTMEVMNLALYNREHYHYKHCLIVCCINSSKLNWYEDIIKHTRGVEIPYILGTRRLKRSGAERISVGSKEKVEDLKSGHKYADLTAPELPYFLIVNIEAFRTKSGKKFTFTQEVIAMINRGDLQMIAIDEIHKNASATSIQGAQLLKVKEASQDRVMYIPMTGTPIVNKPTDVYVPLRLIGGHTFTSYYTWCNHFCVYGGYGGHDIIGYKNIPYLKNLLQANMLRRLKEEVLDLPPIIHFTDYVDNTVYQTKLYDAVVAEMKASKEKLVKDLNPLSAFLRLRQINGAPELVDPTLKLDKDYINRNAKIQMLLDLLEDAHEQHHKVIVFSNWVEPLRTLYRIVSKKYKVCCYVGTMNETDREKHKKVFIENPAYTVMLGTVGAMGVSHTLTVAQTVIFYDEPWTYADKKQAWERAYRIGTNAPLNVHTIITRDTVDDRVHDIVYTKKGIATYIVDGQLDLRSNPSLFDFLIS